MVVLDVEVSGVEEVRLRRESATSRREYAKINRGREKREIRAEQIKQSNKSRKDESMIKRDEIEEEEEESE